MKKRLIIKKLTLLLSIIFYYSVSISQDITNTKNVNILYDNLGNLNRGLVFKYGSSDLSGLTYHPQSGSLSYGVGNDWYLNKVFKISNSEYIYSKWKIGVGTETPQRLIHLNGDKDVAVRLKNSFYNTEMELGVYTYGFLYTLGNKNLQFGTNGQLNRLVISTNGSIGINTENPDSQYKLDVYGKIRTREIVVDMNGAPDYVFESNYNLRTLNEVDNYIKENKHLPEIPSAKEFEENGVAQSEMNKKLLQKIEELTLYMIEQNKKTDKIIKENQDLKNRIKELERK